MRINISIAALILISITSCVPLKDSIYLQGDITKRLKDIEEEFKDQKTDYLVKPNDVLYITVNSLDESTSAFLNRNSGYTQLPESPMSTSLLGYRVNLDGSIDFPFIGKIFVANLTLSDIRDKINLAVSKYIEQSSVTVKLLNDNITVIGEVNSPGRFVLAGEELNIIEALSLAGDVTDYANRRKVRIIRKEGEAHQMVWVNLLDDRVMYSSYFYLKPGDVIYVEPRRLKAWSLSSMPYEFILTILSAGILIMTVTSNRN
ncbi:MAG: polysaccharide biosynthesis/export family protein [Breznakibacter sp.]